MAARLCHGGDTFCGHWVYSCSVSREPLGHGDGWHAGSVRNRHRTEAGVGNKLVAGFIFLAWAPFVIPVLHQRYGDAYCNSQRQWAGLALYYTAAAGVGLAVNYRYVLFAGVTTALLLYLLLALGDERPAQRIKLWRLALFVAAGLLALGYGADLVTAMAIARKYRGDASVFAMIQETLYSLLDTDTLQLYRDADEQAVRSQVYDERYIANPVVARFVETKFHDNLFFLSQNLQPAEIADSAPADDRQAVGHSAQARVEPDWRAARKRDGQAFSMGDTSFISSTEANWGDSRQGRCSRTASHYFQCRFR